MVGPGRQKQFFKKLRLILKIIITLKFSKDALNIQLIKNVSKDIHIVTYIL